MVERGRDDVDDDPTVPRSGVRLLPDEEPAQGVGGGLGNGGYGKHAFTVAAHQRQISRATVREPSRRDSSTLAVVSWARFGAQTAYDVVTVTDDIDEIRAGFWAIVLDFESTLTAVRFAHQGRRSMARPPGYRDWRPLDQTWRTSLDHVAYTDAVREVRRRVAAGTVYQASICRVLSHDLDDDAYLPALAGCSPAAIRPLCGDDSRARAWARRGLRVAEFYLRRAAIGSSPNRSGHLDDAETMLLRTMPRTS